MTDAPVGMAGVEVVTATNRIQDRGFGAIAVH